ncbi:MAG: hypothetical protein GYA51_01495 [Candidatus Methanofastidiosa archaeon]|nr:hypothetical protein [Candidatus Methanofastidiosa archaeon]
MFDIKKYAIREGINPKTINQVKQNHPELVVQDLKEEFNLSKDECNYVRWVLLKRGVNKWLYARRLIIDLKHQMKKLVQENESTDKSKKQLKKEMLKSYERLQNIAKMSRWVTWGPFHNNRRKCDEEIDLYGLGFEEFEAPICNRCNEEKEYDPVLKMYYCRSCNPSLSVQEQSEESCQ